MPLMDPQICFRKLPMCQGGLRSTAGFLYFARGHQRLRLQRHWTGHSHLVFLEVCFHLLSSQTCSENWGIVPIFTSKHVDFIPEKLGRMLKEKLMFLQHWNFKWESINEFVASVFQSSQMARLFLMGISKKVPLVYPNVCIYIYICISVCLQICFYIFTYINPTYTHWYNAQTHLSPKLITATEMGSVVELHCQDGFQDDFFLRLCWLMLINVSRIFYLKKVSRLSQSECNFMASCNWGELTPISRVK